MLEVCRCLVRSLYIDRKDENSCLTHRDFWILPRCGVNRPNGIGVVLSRNRKCLWKFLKIKWQWRDGRVYMYIYTYVLIGILFSGLSFSRLKRVKIAKSDTRSTIMVLCMASMCVVLYFFWFGNSSWIEKKVGEWCGGGEGTQTTKFVCVCVRKKCGKGKSAQERF